MANNPNDTFCEGADGVLSDGSVMCGGLLVLDTPKAFANFIPGFERSENPGDKKEKPANPERVPLRPFRV
jgi:hypothetical protein